MSQQLLDFEEAKKYLKLTKSTFYRLLQNNQIPASKIGRQWRFKKEEIDKWLEESKNVNCRGRSERRKHPRERRSFSLEIRAESGECRPARGVDISQGGLCLRSKQQVMVASDAILFVTAPDEGLKDAKAQMVWGRSQFRENNHTYGAEFVKSRK